MVQVIIHTEKGTNVMQDSGQDALEPRIDDLGKAWFLTMSRWNEKRNTTVAAALSYYIGYVSYFSHPAHQRKGG